MQLKLIRGAPFVLALGLVGLIGCGGDETPSQPLVEATTGGEAPREVATGPVQSYVTDGDSVVMRIDMTRVRESSLSDDIGSLVRSYPTWRDLLGSSGIDPVRDFDHVLVAAPTAVVGRSVMVVHHNMGNARVREAVLTMAVEQNARPQWRQEDGFDVVEWPAATDPPRLVVLTGDRELVVTSLEDLPRVLGVAHDHRLRREGDETIEPTLALDDGVIATVVASELGDATRRRIQYPPDAFALELSDDPEEQGRMRIHADASYADAAAANEARGWFTRQRDYYAGQMLVRAVGLDRPLREAVIEGEGSHVDLRATFTEEEIERVLGLVALGGLGG